MINELIERFIRAQSRKGTAVNIHFRDRSVVNGIFIYGMDYDELKSKNLWRVVPKSKVDRWKEIPNIDLTRIFNGNAFTRLSDEN